MNEITRLHEILQQHLHWHGARIKFLSLFLVALFRVRTVNLSELSLAFAGNAKPESSYKRLQRFLRDFELDYGAWSKFILSLMAIPQPWVLSLDRTNWRFGGVDHNILMLGVVHQGVAIPVLWWMLDKRGNSNSTERLLLIEEFCLLFPDVQLDYLTADREFIGEDWFAYLLTMNPTRFRIRIRESDLLWDGQVNRSGKRLFESLRLGERCILRSRQRLWGHWLYVAGLRLDDGDLLIVVTTHKPRTALRDYAHRWAIETFFGILKSKGFNLEDTHLTDMERLSKLIALLTLAMCWALRTGEWLAQGKPIPIKNHGRKAMSTFRYGADYIRHAVLNLETASHKLLEAMQFLSCT